jgi:hypothetical protein
MLVIASATEMKGRGMKAGRTGMRDLKYAKTFDSMDINMFNIVKIWFYITTDIFISENRLTDAEQGDYRSRDCFLAVAVSYCNHSGSMISD